jgi:ATP-dependent 26S proteasome regulatory subunit
VRIDWSKLHEEFFSEPTHITAQGIDMYNPLHVVPFLNAQKERDESGVDWSSGIYVFRDLHPWLDRDDRANKFNHLLVRQLRDLAQSFSLGDKPRCIILLSPRGVVPQELNKDIRVVDYPLPTLPQLQAHFESFKPQIQRRYGAESIQLPPEDEQSLVRALSGLTYRESENVLRKALANSGAIDTQDIDEILAEKKQIIRKQGIVEYFESKANYEMIGGLDLLKKWLELRTRAFRGEKLIYQGKEFDLPIPKGILLIGVPGSGKSLMAKAIAALWMLPLLRLDVGRIFGGLVGQSEENMRRAIALAESVAPACVWLDEIEKAFPRTSGMSDAGVSLRVMNTFLTWMQEKTAPVFVVATGNDISQMPPELTRKGRFDEIFFSGLPDEEDRKEIWRIHTKPFGLTDEELKQLAVESKYFTGAEIEQALRNGIMILANVQQVTGRFSPLVNAISESLKLMVPLAYRVDEHNESVLAKSLAAAGQIAIWAAKHFEDLPNVGGSGTPQTNAPVRGPQRL